MCILATTTAKVCATYGICIKPFEFKLLLYMYIVSRTTMVNLLLSWTTILQEECSVLTHLIQTFWLTWRRDLKLMSLCERERERDEMVC